MSKVVFIGSTVVDVLLHLPHLPKRSEDINIQTQQLSLGGCAFNASWMCHLLDVEYLLFSPIGTGIYANYIKEEMQKKQLEPLRLQSSEENGCCYCLIEQDGERSFLSHHGAEYKFQREWFTLLDEMDVDTLYICGLEIEEESGSYIIEYLQRHPNLTIYFASGPRLQYIDSNKMKRILACHPILHLNEEEILTYTACPTLKEATRYLYQQNQNLIIVTLGEKGCAYYDGSSLQYVSGTPVSSLDTTGAGDSHIGSFIAYRCLGDSIEEALVKCNMIAKSVVAKEGATLTEQEFQQIKSKSL